jgi:hypothetical protein
VAAVQHTFSHKQYTEYIEWNTYNNYKEKIANYTLEFALQLRKKHGKTSVRVVEKCPDNPVPVVQYTEQHNETEQNIHKNTLITTRNIT